MEKPSNLSLFQISRGTGISLHTLYLGIFRLGASLDSTNIQNTVYNFPWPFLAKPIHSTKIQCSTHTVDCSEIPNNCLGFIKPVINNGISTTYRSTGDCRISEPLLSAPPPPNTATPVFAPGGGDGEALPPAFLGLGGSKIQSSFPPGGGTNQTSPKKRLPDLPGVDE